METAQTPKKQTLAHRLYTGQVSYDFVKHTKLWFTVTGVLLAITVLILVFRGLTLGIEFTGGTDFQVPMTVTETTVDEVRDAVQEFSVPDLNAQVFSIGEESVRIQTRILAADETATLRTEIADVASVAPDQVTYNSIGASWGKEISRQGFVALVVFLGLVMLLIGLYFRNWKMSISAIAAVLHDLLITVAVYALVGFTVTPSTVIGVLTILGYSLYDTVVVFDKVRENTKGLEDGNHTYGYEANHAANQVIIRSLNTTVIGVLPVAALFIAGSWLQSAPLADLGLALLVGMIAGAYSSLFLAVPLLVWLKEREPAMVAHREKLARRAARSQRRVEHRDDVAEAPIVTTVSVPSAEFLAEHGESREERERRRAKQTRSERKRH
ncbi:protein translocase subunit SecF [Tessaracoccus caeni]|uniref:protein translocase subunit SecF n=1 Tax=Tessaracoccus caeni TaxID=3031239 RepID=UPI0023DB4B00|nr:protein translocase subunit SecF [Tessaracoccus caeni]MDF1489397.1 protein translocase subunit SecF [Tessaracoccus caeni]